MDRILICFIFPVLLLPNIQCEYSNFLEYYEESVNDLISHRLTDSKYCESILLPTERTLKKSLQSTFVKAISGTISNEKYKIDLCCRSLYKCDAHKHIELNQTTEIHISYCGCVKLFKTCLKNLNTSLSNEVSFIHAINTTKCFSKVHPIIKCIELEEYSDEIVKLFKFTNLNERAKYFRRCVKYELDQDEKEELQIFDMPFNDDIVLVYKTSGEDMMANIRKLNENEKFSSSEQLAERINTILYFATRTSCDFYRTFFDVVAPNVMVARTTTNSNYGKSKDETKAVKDALDVAKILIKTACANIDLINESMGLAPKPTQKPFIVTSIPLQSSPVSASFTQPPSKSSTTTPIPQTSPANLAIFIQPPTTSQQTSSASKHDHPVIHVEDIKTVNQLVDSISLTIKFYNAPKNP